MSPKGVPALWDLLLGLLVAAVSGANLRGTTAADQRGQGATSPAAAVTAVRRACPAPAPPACLQAATPDLLSSTASTFPRHRQLLQDVSSRAAHPCVSPLFSAPCPAAVPPPHPLPPLQAAVRVAAAAQPSGPTCGVQSASRFNLPQVLGPRGVLSDSSQYLELADADDASGGWHGWQRTPCNTARGGRRSAAWEPWTRQPCRRRAAGLQVPLPGLPRRRCSPPAAPAVPLAGHPTRPPPAPALPAFSSPYPPPCSTLCRRYIRGCVGGGSVRGAAAEPAHGAGGKDRPAQQAARAQRACGGGGGARRGAAPGGAALPPRPAGAAVRRYSELCGSCVVSVGGGGSRLVAVSGSVCGGWVAGVDGPAGAGGGSGQPGRAGNGQAALCGGFGGAHGVPGAVPGLLGSCAHPSCAPGCPAGAFGGRQREVCGWGCG